MLRLSLSSVSFVATLVTTAAATACSSDEDHRSPEERYPGVYADAVCSVLGPCCDANGLSFDEDGCKLGGAGFGALGVERAEQAGAVFDADTADACIAASVKLAKRCLPVTTDADASFTCGSVWNGETAPGGSCSSDLDCASSSEGRGACAFYTDTAGTRRGACVVKTRPAAVDDVCGAPASAPPPAIADCAGSGLQCDVLSRRCKVLVPLGEACAGFDRCVAGAYCDDSGTCVATKPEGEPCAEDGECDAAMCLRGQCAENGAGGLAPCTGEG